MTRLMYGWICNECFIVRLLLNLKVKEFWN